MQISIVSPRKSGPGTSIDLPLLVVQTTSWRPKPFRSSRPQSGKVSTTSKRQNKSSSLTIPKCVLKPKGSVGIFSFAKPTNAYAQEIRKNAEDSSEHTTEVFDSIQEAQNSELWKDRLPHFPPGLTALANTEGGWAASGACVARMMQWFVELGGKVVPGQEFSDFIYTEGDVLAGVLTKGGREFRADQILLAAGGQSSLSIASTNELKTRGSTQPGRKKCWSTRDSPFPVVCCKLPVSVSLQFSLTKSWYKSTETIPF